MDETARRPATDAEARALASGLRLRILRSCLDEPRTNKEIAAAVGRDPATTLHHVRRLVATGFLAAEAERRGARNSREVPYRATGKSWRVSSPAADHGVLDAFAEEVALVPVDAVDTIRLGLRLDTAGRRALIAEVVAVLERFRDAPAGEDAQPVSLFVAVHPDPNRA